MRWGIQNDAYAYHGTTDLCLKEIKNCRQNSTGPYFVVSFNNILFMMTKGCLLNILIILKNLSHY